MESLSSSTWLFYATKDQRGAKWLDQAREGSFVFWRHGSDAHTRSMQPGDTAIIYIAGENIGEGQIVAIGLIPSVRRPFILDNEYRVQRIPCLLVKDLRSQNLTWQDVRRFVDETPTSNQGAVHPVKSNVVAVISQLSQTPLPLSSTDYKELLLNGHLWNELQRYSDYFTIFPDFITRNKRKALELNNEDRVTSESEFDSIIRTSLESFSSETHENFKEPVKKALSSKMHSVNPEPLETSFSTPGIIAARSFPDTVAPRTDEYTDVDNEATAFARLIASEESKPPLAIGVFGRWGSGKTFFMTRIAQELDKIKKAKNDDFKRGIVQVDFNAWHYMETNVWASLVDVIFKALDSEQSKQGNNNQESLFDRLSTAQNMRMDAIVNLADRLHQTSEARKNLHSAQREFKEKGPDGDALWRTVASSITGESGEKIKDAAVMLGFEGIDVNGRSVREVTADLRKSITGGTIAIRVLRSKFTSPKLLLLLSAMLIGVPLVINGIMNEYENFLSTLFAITAAWGALVANAARRGLKLLHQLSNTIMTAEQNALNTHHNEVEAAESKLSEAKQSLQAAEENVVSAFQALEEESPGSRLASFIRQRAESEDYSKHFGVIATIRRDFEQLSELMRTAENTIDQDTNNKFRNEMNNRIEAFKVKHPNLFPSENCTQKNSEIDSSMNEEIFGIQKAVQKLLNSLDDRKTVNKPFTRIVLKIDDLDRCPPEKVIDVLQAVHLFLNFPLFIILVCVDERWLSTSLSEKFSNLVNGSNGATTSDYLEKIFQIPYWTQPMNEEATSKLAGYLLADIAVEPETPQDRNSAIDIKPSLKWNTDPSMEQDVYASMELNIDASEIPENSLHKDLIYQQILKPEKADYSPLTLTNDELKTVQRVAALAGDTPRRTLRFINVYLLLKSTNILSQGTQITEKDSKSFSYQAMLIQLALATRADSISRYYFTALDSFIQREVSKDQLSASKFLSSILADLDNSLSTMSHRDKNLCRKVVDMYLILSVNAAGPTKDKIAALSKSDADKQLMADILHTEKPARRYTFIPS